MGRNNNSNLLDGQMVQQRINMLATQDNEQSAFQFKPHEMQEKKDANQSVNQAMLDNRMIDMAMQNSQAYKLDVTEKARLESIKGRNLAHILLNNHRFRKDSPEMKAVKDAIDNLEKELQKPIKFDVVGDFNDPGLDEKERRHIRVTACKNTEKMCEIEALYRTAIFSCSEYLKQKKPKSDKGVERFTLVAEKRQSLINELNSINTAKQLVFRGLIGKEPVSAKDLMIAQKEYCSKNAVVSKERLETFQSEEARIRSFNTASGEYNDEKGDYLLSKEGELLLKLFTRASLPNALVESLGKSKEKKEQAISQIKGLWRALTLFKENTLQSITLNIGGNIFSLFQKEDNSLDLIFSNMKHNTNGVTDKSAVKNLNISAKRLAIVLGKNMIENEEVFGKQQTTTILNFTKDINKDSSLIEKTNANEIGNSLMIKRLGLTNIDFTNIPTEEVLKKAKELNAGKISEDEARNWVRNYEFGDKEKKKKERDELLSKKKKEKKESDIEEKSLTGKTVDEAIKDADLEEELAELTKEENEKLMEKGAGESYVTDALKQMDEQNARIERQKRNAEREEKKKNFSGNNEDENKYIEVDRQWEQRIREVTSKYTAEIQRIREEQKALIAGKNEELKKLETQQKDILGGNIEKRSEALDKLADQSDPELEELERFLNDGITKNKSFTQKKNGLSTNPSDIDKKVAALDQKILTLRNEINSQNAAYNQRIENLEATKVAETDSLEKEKDNELSIVESWMEHNVRCAGTAETMTLEQWKEHLKETHLQRQKELEEENIQKENREKRLSFYRDLSISIKELEEKELSTTTDEKVNGLDTLELLRHREKVVSEGRLSKMIIYTSDIKKVEEEKEEKAEKAKEKEYREKVAQLDIQIKAAEKDRADKRDFLKKTIAEKDNAIKEIESAQDAILEEVSKISAEYDQKMEEHAAYLNSEQAVKEKEEVTAGYLNKLEALNIEYEKCREEIAKKRSKENPEKLQELLLRDYLSKKNAIEDEFTRNKNKWEKEPNALKFMREQMEQLADKTVEHEMKRIALFKERKELNNQLEEVKNQSFSIQDLRTKRAKNLKWAEESRRRIEQREAEKVRKQKEEAKAEEDKKLAIKEGREWSEDEEKIKNFIADIIFSSSTWDMDNEQKPGERIWGILAKNKDLIGKIVSDKKIGTEILKGFVSKLPLGIIGDSASDIDRILEDTVEQISKMAEEKLKEEKAAVEERDRLREEHRQANDERRRLWEEAQEKRRREWEAANAEKQKVKKEEKYKEFVRQHKEYNELSEKEKRQKFEESQKKPGGFLGLFGNLFSKKEQDDEEKFVEEKFVEEEYDDPYYYQDKIFKGMTDKARITMGVNMILTGKREDMDALGDEVQTLIRKEKEIEDMVHLKLRKMEKTFSRYVNKEFGAGSDETEEKQEEVKYYREKGISKEERERRIEQGEERLNTMIASSLKGKEGEGQYFRNIISQYLSLASTIDLRSMISSAIRNAKPARLDENSTEEQRYQAFAPMLGGLLKGAGPLLQKTLQGMPDILIPKGLEGALSDMKDNLAPIPKEIVEAQLIAMVERSQGQIQSIELTKSLGAASVGQAFLCKVHMNDGSAKDVVIKLLRPDVRNRMLREEKIMRKCAADTGEGMLRTFEGQMERIREELDLTIEAKNCERGALYNDANNNISAMKVSRIVEPTANSLMVERAEGDTVIGVLKNTRAEKEKYLKAYYKYDKDGDIVMDGNHPKLQIPVGDAKIQEARTVLSKRLNVLFRQQRMLAKMAEKWVMEAVFGNGFYHGDLHAGNIMMSDSRLTIIDFGNATKLTEVQQETMTRMLLATAAGSGDGFYEAYKGLLGKESKELLKTKGKELRKVFNEVMHLGDANSSAQRIGAALVRAQQLGFELPGVVSGFQQCQQRIQNTIDEFNKEITEIQDAMKQLKAADSESKFDLTKEYLKNTSDTKRINGIKFNLVSPESEDFRELLRDRTASGRAVLDNILGSNLDTIMNIRKYGFQMFSTMDEEMLKEFISSGLSIIYGQEAFDDFIKIVHEKNPKKKEEVFNSLLKKYEPLDVMGTLTDLREAQDTGESEEVLKDKEEKFIYAYNKTREAFFESQKKDKNKGATDYSDPEALVGAVKKNLRKIENKAQAEAEFKTFFENEKYGEKMKAAFDRYFIALENKAENAEELLGQLIESMRMPLLTGFYDAKILKTDERPVDYSKPDNFLEIMKTVIMDEWKKALKRVSIIDAIKYGWRINEDLTGENMGIKDMLSILMG